MKSPSIPPIHPDDLVVPFDIGSVRLGERPMSERRLADLEGCFADEIAYRAMLQKGNPVIYAVTTVTPANGEGQLHYGLAVVYPGMIGREYHLTRGHYHAFLPASEVYVGLAGEGGILLEDAATGESRFLPLRGNSVVYVPGNTAHRTINTGADPLVYLGIYPSCAGHDYDSIAQRNFRKIVIQQDGSPAVVDRDGQK